MFNFSVLYSNYAIEALYTIIVFNKRVDQIMTRTMEYAELHKKQEAVTLNSGETSIKCSDMDVIWSAADYAETGKPVLQSISF